eukprot:scpid111946/ scgid21323/ 
MPSQSACSAGAWSVYCCLSYCTGCTCWSEKTWDHSVALRALEWSRLVITVWPFLEPDPGSSWQIHTGTPTESESVTVPAGCKIYEARFLHNLQRAVSVLASSKNL